MFQVASVCILENKKAHTISLMWCYSCAIFSPLSPDRHLCLFVCRGSVWTVAWCPCFVCWQKRWFFCYGFIFFIFRRCGNFFATITVDSNNSLVQAGIIWWSEIKNSASENNVSSYWVPELGRCQAAAKCRLYPGMLSSCSRQPALLQPQLPSQWKYLGIYTEYQEV